MSDLNRIGDFLDAIRRRVYLRSAKIIVASGLLSPKRLEVRRLYHYHIRKTAGTSVNSAFVSSSPLRQEKYFRLLHARSPHIIWNHGRPVVGWDKEFFERGSFFFGFSHIPYWDIIIPERTFSFTVVRDPLERLLSYYKMLRLYQVSRKWSMIDAPHAELDQEVEYIRDNFQEFLNHLPRQHLLNQLYMFSQDFKVDVAIDNASKIDRIYESSNLSLMVREMNLRFGMTLSIPEINRSDFRLNLGALDISKARSALGLEYEFYDQVRRLPNFASKL